MTSRQHLSWLLYFLLTHCIGLLLFTRGFLPARPILPNISPLYDNVEVEILPARFERVLLVIIDALRFDFMVSTTLSNEYHHHILKHPIESLQQDPLHNLIFNAFSDPPTATMQRIKGITTGSLPTFIEVSASFGGAAVMEDNILAQLKRNGKQTVLMGDDTWLTLFPDTFTEAYPFDSFNVEDLHTVDYGVIHHLMPILDHAQKNWTLAVAHFLGVDHVGHRVGPDHILMREKLTQMDGVLRDITQRLDDQTLLVVMGDHGMNSKGDHGGDSALETSSALWLHSKSTPLNFTHLQVQSPGETPKSSNAGNASQRSIKFPGHTQAWPTIDQTDLLSTICLLLNIPIPFNNLGFPILSTFEDPWKAMEVTRRHMARYLDALAPSPQIKALQLKFEDADGLGDLVAAFQDSRTVWRSTWSTFNKALMIIGLIILSTSIILLSIRDLAIIRFSWQRFISIFTIIFVSQTFFVTKIEAFLGALAISSQWTLINSCNTSYAIPWSALAHALTFSTNSFIILEEYVVMFLSNTLNFWKLCKTVSIRHTAAYVSIILLTRGIGAVRTCRDETIGQCRMTFATSQGKTPVYTQVLLYLAVFLTLYISQRLFPHQGRLHILVALSLCLGTLHWLIDNDINSHSWTIRTTMARGNLVLIFAQLMISIYQKSPAYAVGGLYSSIWLSNQPIGQLSLACIAIIILLHRWALPLQSTEQNNHWGLLALLSFFGTGHHTVLSSIQWRSAFYGFNTVVYPLAPVLLAFNTMGGPILIAAALPMVSKSRDHLFAQARQLSVYHLILTTFSAIFSAHLRRHLMVWGVFAPRFMTAAVMLLLTDLTTFISMSIFYFTSKRNTYNPDHHLKNR